MTTDDEPQTSTYNYIIVRVKEDGRSADMTNAGNIRKAIIQAVIAYVEELKAEGQGSQVVSVEARGQRRYYRWNGVTFAEVPDFLLPWADNT
jgi:hypothetical protein